MVYGRTSYTYGEVQLCQVKELYLKNILHFFFVILMATTAYRDN